MSPPAPPVTSAELQEKLKPVALDVAIVRRSVEQLASNQDQLARKQEQMAQAIAALQAVEQDIRQKISTPPPPKMVHVPPPKPPQPAAQ
jgi:chromosome segregation ATPase